MELYKPFKSKAKNKKYSVYVKGGKLIHFGDKRYGQYKDKIGLYSHLDHNKFSTYKCKFNKFINVLESTCTCRWYSSTGYKNKSARSARRVDVR